MATEKDEIEKHVKIALDEIGKIEPWYDQEVGCWVFSHSKYPTVECGGTTAKNVKKDYPTYLKEFIRYRLKNQLNEQAEKKTRGRGGYRPRAGRPKGTQGEEKRRIYLPTDIVDWLKQPDSPEYVRILHTFLNQHKDQIRSPKELKRFLPKTKAATLRPHL